MVHQRLPDKFVQFVRDNLVNIDCSMFVVVLPMFRLFALAFSLCLPFCFSVSRARKRKRFSGIWKDVFLRWHVGQGILEEPFRSQTSEWGQLER